MSEPGDFVPPPQWRTHDFKKAKDYFDSHAGRSYDDAVASGKIYSDFIEPQLTSEAIATLSFVCDVTGSVGTWPATMFSKLPYLELEAQEYLGKDLDINWSAIGDAHHTDQYPLQVRPFARGTKLKDYLEEIVKEGGGGGQTTETYEIAALYYTQKVVLPNAIHSVLIFFGDEKPYDYILPEHAKKYVGIDAKKRLLTKDVFAELKKKYSVYLIRKPYGTYNENNMSAVDVGIYEAWANLLGSDHIADISEAGRIVDVIFGILAKETGRIPYFRKEIEDRQKSEQVETVYKSLKTIHALPAPAQDKTKKKGHSGKSIMFPPPKKK
ncbi:MAG: hypothetical protein HYT37_02345 [Candidatus Sungbacteria bacterium]|nr:hypothetical protein [Candidatus Sungbacteria bacterium]